MPVKLVCEWCGKEFKRSPSLVSTHNFCCVDCSRAWQKENNPKGENHACYKGGNTEVVCEQCGKKFFKIPSRVTKHNFCCREHQKLYEKDGGYPENRVFNFVKCETCGKEFTKTTNHLNRTNHHFCSKECAWDWQKINNPRGVNHYEWQGGPVKKNCLNCGKEFEVSRNALKQEHHGKYCSYKCYTQHREYPRGENHPRWIPGEKKQELRRLVTYSEWRTKVFKRDNYVCQVCHKRGKKLQAHHIYEFAKYDKLRLEVRNGLTLCVKCHKELHKKDSHYNLQVKLL